MNTPASQHPRDNDDDRHDRHGSTPESVTIDRRTKITLALLVAVVGPLIGAAVGLASVHFRTGAIEAAVIQQKTIIDEFSTKQNQIGERVSTVEERVRNNTASISQNFTELRENRQAFLQIMQAIARIEGRIEQISQTQREQGENTKGGA